MLKFCQRCSWTLACPNAFRKYTETPRRNVTRLDPVGVDAWAVAGSYGKEYETVEQKAGRASWIYSLIKKPDGDTRYQDLVMKTERIEFMAPRGLKAKLQEEAKDLNISLGVLIRRRLELSDEERELAKLTASLKKSMTEAHRDWTFAVEEVTKLVAALRHQKCRTNHQSQLQI